MTPLYTEKSWFALKIFFGKGKPIKDYFVTNNIEHVYDVKKEFWDKTKKKRFVKDVPVMPSLILFRTTRVEAEHIERLFLNKVMLYRGKNSEDRREPSKIPEREVQIFKIVVNSGIEGLDFYDDYNPKFVQGDKFRVIDGPLKGAEGYVVRIKKDHRLYVSIQGLCAVTTGYIPKAFLQKIEWKQKSEIRVPNKNIRFIRVIRFKKNLVFKMMSVQNNEWFKMMSGSFVVSGFMW